MKFSGALVCLACCGSNLRSRATEKIMDSFGENRGILACESN